MTSITFSQVADPHTLSNFSITNPEEDEELKSDMVIVTPSHRTKHGDDRPQRKHTSDVIDSVAILSIPLEDELYLIREYFPLPPPPQIPILTPPQIHFASDGGTQILEYTINVLHGPDSRISSDGHEADGIPVRFKCTDQYPYQVEWAWWADMC